MLGPDTINSQNSNDRVTSGQYRDMTPSQRHSSVSGMNRDSSFLETIITVETSETPTSITEVEMAGGNAVHSTSVKTPMPGSWPVDVVTTYSVEAKHESMAASVADVVNKINASLSIGVGPVLQMMIDEASEREEICRNYVPKSMVEGVAEAWDDYWKMMPDKSDRREELRKKVIRVNGYVHHARGWSGDEKGYEKAADDGTDGENPKTWEQECVLDRVTAIKEFAEAVTLPKEYRIGSSTLA